MSNGGRSTDRGKTWNRRCQAIVRRRAVARASSVGVAVFAREGRSPREIRCHEGPAFDRRDDSPAAPAIRRTPAVEGTLYGPGRQAGRCRYVRYAYAARLMVGSGSRRVVSVQKPQPE